MMSTHSPTTRPARIAGILAAAGLAASVAILPACGGDDDGGAATLDDSDFCSLVIETTFAALVTEDDEYGAGVERALGGLADQAPTDELRAAMTTFAEYAEKVDALDMDDPDDMWEVIELLGDPSFIEANDTLDTYLAETCDFANAAD